MGSKKIISMVQEWDGTQVLKENHRYLIENHAVIPTGIQATPGRIKEQLDMCSSYFQLLEKSVQIRGSQVQIKETHSGLKFSRINELSVSPKKGEQEDGG